jgi:very-short-patch-repair endonuclease
MHYGMRGLAWHPERQTGARLREAGFEVVHFTWPQVTRTPDQVVASIKAAFRRGSVR